MNINHNRHVVFAHPLCEFMSQVREDQAVLLQGAKRNGLRSRKAKLKSMLQQDITLPTGLLIPETVVLRGETLKQPQALIFKMF